MTSPRTERSSNFELLRIVAMCMIVAAHYAGHGVRHVSIPLLNEVWLSGSSVNQAVTAMLMPGGKIGVGIFFALTGYFMIDKEWKIQRILKLILTVYFYALLMLVMGGGIHLFSVFLPQSDTYWIDNLPSVLGLFVKACFPITSKSWWFITSYVLLFLLIPVLNCFIKSLENNGFAWVFALLAFVWYATTVFNFAYVDVQRAVFFYIVGAWIKRSGIVFNKWVALTVFAVSWLAFVGCDMISAGIVWHGLARGKVVVKFLESIEIVFCVPVAVLALFSFFRACNVRESRFINIIASTSFGVYLLHDSSLGRQLIWDGILHTLDKQYESCFFPFFALLSVVLVFGCCSAIDLVRQCVFERKVLPLLGSRIKDLF